jgi:hypothetical protein
MDSHLDEAMLNGEVVPLLPGHKDNKYARRQCHLSTRRLVVFVDPTVALMAKDGTPSPSLPSFLFFLSATFVLLQLEALKGMFWT